VEYVPMLGGEDREAKELMGLYDVPAYVRRARQVEGAFETLVARCRQQREEWLAMVRLRVGLLRALAGDWQALRPLLDDDQLDLLRDLHDHLSPTLRVPVEPTASPRALRRALEDLRESVGRFNRRWEEFLAGIDLAEVNQLREDYNRYYVLEKECALRSATAARHGFQRLRPLGNDEIAALFPPLPLLKIK
jgi:hypothetical protein